MVLRKEDVQEGLRRVWTAYNRIVVDDQVIGDRFDDPHEMHLVRHWLTLNYKPLKSAMVLRHLNETDECD